MARNNVVTGVFARAGDADQAKLRLVEAGVAADCIALSTDLSADSVAAECPGQSYSNQPGQASGEDFLDADTDTAHVGACVLRVDLGSNADRGSVELIMRQCGARQPWRHP